jgi:hypothetical protein
MKKLITACIFSFLTLSAFAQTNDFGMWNTVSINKSLNSKLGLGIDQELRLRDNCTTINLVYTNFGVNYKVNNWFKVALVYRFIDKHKDDFTWGVRHRVFTDLTFKAKPGNFALSYRARFQMEWRGVGYDASLGNAPEVFLRNQVKCAYKGAGNFEPYAGIEIRWQIQNPRIPYHEAIDRGRYFGGVNYEINKHNTVGTYFLLQKEINVIDRQTLYIWGLEYTLNL